MSYIFDVSEEHNDLLEVDSWIMYDGYGDYKGYNRRDKEGHMIYNVEFRDKRYALQFKLKFNAVTVLWDESDDEEIVTEDELMERGYQLLELSVEDGRGWEFEEWCKERKFAVLDEMKVFRDREPFKVFVPNRGTAAMVRLAWA